MMLDPVEKQSGSMKSWLGAPIGVVLPPRLEIPVHSSSSDRSPPGLL